MLSLLEYWHFQSRRTLLKLLQIGNKNVYYNNNTLYCVIWNILWTILSKSPVNKVTICLYLCYYIIINSINMWSPALLITVRMLLLLWLGLSRGRLRILRKRENLLVWSLTDLAGSEPALATAGNFPTFIRQILSHHFIQSAISFSLNKITSPNALGRRGRGRELPSWELWTALESIVERGQIMS